MSKQVLGWFLLVGFCIAAAQQAKADVPPVDTRAGYDWMKEGGYSGNLFGHTYPAGDVNGDGYDDVVAAGVGDAAHPGNADVYHGSSTGLHATAAWTKTGENNNDEYGHTGIGADVNGDGYDDLIITAEHYPSGAEKGRAYAYYGSSAGASNTASWTADGEADGDWFGHFIAPRADFNNDGYDDVVIGARFWNGGNPNGYGKVYCYYGSSSGLSATAAWTNEGENAGDQFGGRMGVGDVNGDGYDDLLVGAFYGGAGGEGKAYCYHGSAAGLSNSAAWTEDGENASDLFSSSLCASDVNRDGYDDAVIGAHGYPSDAVGNTGKAYVYMGSPGGLSASPAWSLAKAGADDFGDGCSGGFDMNGDGYEDVIISDHWYDNGTAGDSGRIWVYHGTADGLSTEARWTMRGNQAGAAFGNSPRFVGDVNRDGCADLAAGARYYTGGIGANQGRVYVYYGLAAGLSAEARWTFESDSASAQVGGYVGQAGDVNGDGYADVIAGARGYNGANGRAHCWYGSVTGLHAAADWITTGSSAASYGSVGTGGDFNGDGYNDVLVGEQSYNAHGRAFLFYGSGGGLATTAAWTNEGGAGNELFGNRVMSAGDVDGDGDDEIIISDQKYDNGGSADAGAVYVFYGSGSGPGAAADWTKIGENAGDLFGAGIGAAGDVNGDGYGDVVVGARGHDGGDGKVYLYYGRSDGLSNSASWTYDSAVYSEIGVQAEGAGDVNGDGYADILASGHLYNGGGGAGNDGIARVWYGSSNGPSAAADWTTFMNQDGAYYGLAAGPAGDVNADGYDDIIVGARSYDYPNDNTGGAWLYYGSSNGLSTTAIWMSEGPQSGCRFGNAVHGAGDVDGNGFADVVVGAYYYDSGGTAQEGLVSLFYAYGQTSAAFGTMIIVR